MALTDYKKITITGNLDPNTASFDVKDIERDVRSLINNAVKSSLPEGAFYKLSPKSLSSQGQYSVDLYVHGDSATLTKTSISQQVASEMKFAGSVNPRYSVSNPSDVDRRTTKALMAEEKGQYKEGERGRRLLGVMTQISGLITSLVVIARRILSNMISMSTRTSQDMLTAHNLGISYEAARNYRYAETTHNLKEGTISGAISDIQSKFGNITSLDEKALEALAVVMGGKIEEMATMGLGASNPDAVLGAILDAFNAKANSGYNSVGQYVGEQQARRELYSYLLKVSPQIADIFATMQEEQHNINSLYRNQAETFEQWKTAVPPNRNPNTWAGYGELKIVSEQWQKISAMIDKIKEGIAVALAPDVVRLLQRIANSRLFMTETQKRALNEENRAKNKAELESISRTISGINPDTLSEGERAYYDVLVEQKKALEKENAKEEVDDITTLPADLEARAERKVRQRLNRPASEGGSPVEGVTYAEISDVVAAYNYDTEAARRKYKKYREDQVREAEKDVDKYNREEKARVGNQYFDTLSSLDSEFQKIKASSRGDSLAKAKKAFKGNLANQQALEILYQTGKMFPEFQYDLEHGEGTNYEERLYKALEHAITAGYVNRGQFGGYTVSKDKYVEENYKPLQHLGGEVAIDYGNAYLWWLYQTNMLTMGEHIKGYRTDQTIASMQKLNALAATQWLSEEEVVNKALSKALADLPLGTYNIRGVNERTGSGENIYRIVLDVAENGRVTSSKELLSFEGGIGHEGDFASATKRGNGYSLNILSTTASQMQANNEGD